MPSMIASGNTTIRNKKISGHHGVCFRSWHAPAKVSRFLNCGTPTKQRLLQGIRSTEDSWTLGGTLTCCQSSSGARTAIRIAERTTKKSERRRLLFVGFLHGRYCSANGRFAARPVCMSATRRCGGPGEFRPEMNLGERLGAEVGPAGSIWLRQPIAFHRLMSSACTLLPTSLRRSVRERAPKSLRNQKSAARLVTCAAREPQARECIS